MKLGIVGSGLVGATAGYALVMQGVGREIILVDKNEARAEAEADDIRHAVPFAHPLDIRSGGYEDLAVAVSSSSAPALDRNREKRGSICCSETPKCFVRRCLRF